MFMALRPMHPDEHSLKLLGCLGVLAITPPHELVWYCDSNYRSRRLVIDRD